MLLGGIGKKSFFLRSSLVFDGTVSQDTVDEEIETGEQQGSLNANKHRAARCCVPLQELLLSRQGEHCHEQAIETSDVAE